ncbi:rhodanese-like domain-containing protein [Desulfonatronum thiosulfatophilum]|uniref:rhodanese-like domain-containing protein n=1 Tax=Desulfonatronum thiosulfatophilum TaxID=617002 RepID=UPI0013797406|nr:rhodanese-like domain-containing protein [Desulfonatronum thiosulfatophilum]
MNEERRDFQLNVLFETVRELSQLTDPSDVMKSFVLLSMGPLGTAQALLAAKDAQSGNETVALRGFAADFQDALDDLLTGLTDKVSAGEEMLPHQVRVVTMNENAKNEGLPESLRILVEWYVDRHCFGVLGYGPKVSGEPYDHQDEEFLLRLTSAFMDALKVSNVNETIRRLNDELRIRNENLHQALLISQETQTRLDQRYFHFRTVCDTTRELSGNLDKDSLLSSFLLSVMGAFSAQHGFIVLWNRDDQSISSIHRGYPVESVPDFDVQRLNQVFRALLHPPFVPSQGEKHYQVLDLDTLLSLGLDDTSQIAAAFLIDANFYGLMVVGNCLAQQKDGLSDEELFPTLLQGFLVSLGNALAFETIQKLNSDLLQRNAELRQTLEDLQQSRQTISLLEAAANRINSLLKTETLRIKRVTLVDCMALFMISLFLGLIFNVTSPGRIPVRPETWSLPPPNLIDVSWARLKHASQGSIFLDARPVEFYNQTRIAGAESLPLNLFEFVYSMRFAQLDPKTDIVVYGRNVSRRYDELVAAKLAERGMVNVRVMDGGLRQWQRQGLPVEP